MPPVVLAPLLSPKWSIATEGLDAEERQFILDRMRPLSFDPRAILFDQGEPSDTLVLLTEGRVRLYQTLEGGEEFTFGLCVAGAILGLAALVTDEPRILSAVALEPVTASVMTRTDFMDCLNMVPRFHWNITRLLAILSLSNRSSAADLWCSTAPLYACAAHSNRWRGWTAVMRPACGCMSTGSRRKNSPRWSASAATGLRSRSASWSGSD
jgi:CRP-like cAMP-binding protein